LIHWNSFRRFSAATDRDDDFQLVAVGQDGIGMLAARHDLAVAFDGQPFAGQAEVFQQQGKGGSALEGMRLAVDGESGNFRLRLSISWPNQ
jgi:hypothetical protein